MVNFPKFSVLLFNASRCLSVQAESFCLSTITGRQLRRAKQTIFSDDPSVAAMQSVKKLFLCHFSVAMPFPNRRRLRLLALAGAIGWDSLRTKRGTVAFPSPTHHSPKIVKASDGTKRGRRSKTYRLSPPMMVGTVIETLPRSILFGTLLSDIFCILNALTNFP